VIFPYLALPTRRPVTPLAGAMVRYRPIIPVRIFGPSGSRLLDGCVDCGSDDTMFPLSLAGTLGIDLTGAPQGEACPVGGMIVSYVYAPVTLRVTDGLESFQWQTSVDFVDLPLRWALLGHAGFLDFFDTDLRGARREVFLTPNALFPGTQVRCQSPVP
jgi:hypothetical protein